MIRKPAVHVPEVSGIDLDYRPRDYFWALDANVRLTSGISGKATSTSRSASATSLKSCLALNEYLCIPA